MIRRRRDLNSRLKKIAWILSTVLVLATASRIQAWGWDAHENITEVAYDALPDNIKDLLILSKIEEGWKAPDDWKDHPHEFPDKYSQAVDALEKAREYYQRAQYSDASFWLGVAAHYIQDMVSLPHCVYGETREEHKYFESTVARTLSIAAPSRMENFDLYSELQTYNDESRQKWDNWLATENTVYVQEGLDLAASLTYNAWYQTLENVVPAEAPTLPLLPVATAGAVAALIIVVILAWWWRAGSAAVSGHPATKARRWTCIETTNGLGLIARPTCTDISPGVGVKKDTLVWCEGMKSWKKISEVETSSIVQGRFWIISRGED
jgi:hypothetical protein